MEAPGSSLRQLAGRLQMDEPTASRIVAGLSRRRLVSTRQDALDRRRRKLELTTEGLGTLNFSVRDELKRTWSRETRLERTEKKLEGLTPQLTGKYAKT